MVSVATVIAVGVSELGKRHVLGIDVGASEDEAFWTQFLRSLVERGLGFSVPVATEQGLFYMGNAVAPSLATTTRRRLGRLLGSTSHAFLLRPA